MNIEEVIRLRDLAKKEITRLDRSENFNECIRKVGMWSCRLDDCEKKLDSFYDKLQSA